MFIVSAIFKHDFTLGEAPSRKRSSTFLRTWKHAYINELLEYIFAHVYNKWYMKSHQLKK